MHFFSLFQLSKAKIDGNYLVGGQFQIIMDEVHAETTLTEGPLLEERIPSTKAAFKHQTQGLTLNPTFGSPNGDTVRTVFIQSFKLTK